MQMKVDSLLFITEEDHNIIGSVMAGCDGHRGWLYSIAVAPMARRRRIGSKLVEYSIEELRALGCVKVNLQVRATNADVVTFYQALGFRVEARISMGKLIGAPGA